MSGTIKAVLLLAAVTAATLRSCERQRQHENSCLHRPSKIDSVAFREDDHDSLKVWDVTDSLRDPKDRIRLVSTQIFKEYDYTAWLKTQPEFSRASDSLGVQRITKADVDGNGLTDLIMSVGGQPIVILDDGANHYRTLPLTIDGGLFDEIFPVFHRTGGQQEILCYYFPWNRGGMRLPGDKLPPLKVDTLIYYKGDFIEKNSHPITYKVEHIHLSQGCSQLCAPFDLFIDSVGKAIYVSHYSEDTAATIIDRRSLEKIYDLLCYIDFPRLQDYYEMNGTDQQTFTTTIIYNGGKTKTISDYGQVGTHGLWLLYEQLLKLRVKKQWTKIGESSHR